jgi:2-keto-4-pentenoate hydratase/2-oxohepta-3-ene-1,7-dioic acid hydratase in catechol pathway
LLKDEPRVGSLVDDQIIDLSTVGVAADMVEFITGGESAREAALRATANGEALDRNSVKLLPPVPRPPKVICVARNYAAHAAEANRELLEFPNLFVRFANTLVADGEPVLRPRVSEELDWEGELAFVIGKGGRHIREQDAYDHIFGYSIFNDVTVRDYQFRVPQFVAGKNFETTGPFGPAVVTRAEIRDPHDLNLQVTVNDEVVQSVNTGEMVFKIPFLVAHVSEFISLEPGDVIATGTPAGVGFVRKPPRFLVPGDVMRVSIDGLGVLQNPVGQEPRP